jgi:hypothetical protein
MTLLATALAALTITFWPQGMDGPKQTRTLRCNPPAGTLPMRASACRKLAAVEQPFRLVPKDAICTEIYGGPEVALVRGTFRGQRIWTYFRRNNGCHISRWNQVKFLFPAPGA